MAFNLRVVADVSVLKLFVCVIALPSILVMITIGNMGRENHQHKVTHEVFFDIEIDGKSEGRIVFGLFGETVPLTVKNFYALATTGYKGYEYKGTIFHRVIRKFMIQGGDIVHKNGSGRLSIYGDHFPDENFDIHHSTAGFLSMANAGKDVNSCQFFITTLSTPWLDGSHVAFGKVIEGQGVVHKIEHLKTDWNDKPVKTAKIVNSGPRKISKPYWISDDPYNLMDWLKTISFPLGLSFSIIFLFNHFIKRIDRYISASDNYINNLRKQDDSGEKKASLTRRQSESACLPKSSDKPTTGLRARKYSERDLME